MPMVCNKNQILHSNSHIIFKIYTRLNRKNISGDSSVGRSRRNISKFVIFKSDEMSEVEKSADENLSEKQFYHSSS